MRGVMLLVVLSGCVTVTRPELTAPSTPNTSGVAERLELALPRYPGGEAWTLSSLRGRVVLLDVWATWCEPCRDAMPLYGDLQKEFGPRGLEVMTINIDADPQPIAAFLTEAKVSLPVLRDPEAAIAESKLKVKLMPTAFLIDRRGVIRHVHEGFDEGELSTWLAEIEALLAEPAPAATP
jgi:cytochrome c biogenesis protein CcmG, thiol:disulfide interchange protein DsbE